MTDTVGVPPAAGLTTAPAARRRIPARTPHQAKGRARGSGRLGGPLSGLPWALPALLLVGVLLVYPFFRSVYGSLFEDNGFTSHYTGLDNYVRLAEDPIFGRSLLNTVMWVAGTLLLPVVAGLAIAVATHRMRFGRIAQLVVVLPCAISGAATAVLWKFILTSEGSLNQVLQGLGLDSLVRPWLLEWPQNTVSMIVASTWQATGLNVVLFAIGLSAIPRETVEAAELDGATGWRMFRHITLPQLRSVSVVVIGMAIVNSLKAFDMIWVLTQGGPARSSETLALTMYRESFRLFHVGYGSAVALVLSVIVVASSWMYLRRQMPETSPR
ncbi:sugar ABC transporter permease [Streptomyces sp. NBC_00569]|uniref:carbohydrate ABC transporter permease n=1 Tax=unclassified Streptomyces TaxID=2593676 RepID=UPI00225869A2|nr:MULTISPECIES: sugar ABC transporter permease [unclassified Streptomyces]MCX5443161.1 sugar ABC transporter permease [Streptomyces sp. NBC_00063]WUB98582.1 sugar ABC transporter permease [Streptomyces sp. NBC_00569]